MNNCPKCGLTVEPGAQYCGNCGQKLETIQATPDNSMGGVPQYAVEQVIPSDRKWEIEATVALLFGVAAIPSALFIPLVALILGMAGIILGTIARSKYKHMLSLLAVIISALGLLAGIAIWGYSLSKNQSLALRQGSVQQTSRLVTVNTPCYSVKVDSGLNNYSPTNCNFNAASTAEEFSVNAVSNPNITTSNLNELAPSIFGQAIAKTGGTYVSGSPGSFAGSNAYIVYADDASQNTKGIFAMVVHSSSNIDNVYIIGRTIRTTDQPTFGPIESNWKWK